MILLFVLPYVVGDDRHVPLYPTTEMQLSKISKTPKIIIITTIIIIIKRTGNIA
jgi:hypothetical protein